MADKPSPSKGERADERPREIVFLPLGGCGEIGMNLYLYGQGPANRREWLMVDFGVKFGDERDPGVDVILPDISFIEDERRSLQGIVLTHAHEDHFGAVAHLWSRLKVPVYATAFAAKLLRRKLIEAGLEDDVPLREIGLDERFDVGGFDCEFLSVTHSIPEPNAVVIRSGGHTIVHSGDWKIDDKPVVGDPIDESRLSALREEGCNVLICDSTNVLRDGSSPSETDVADGLAEVIGSAKKRVAVTTFASNVGRVASIARAADACDRHVVVIGRALRNNIEAARETGYLRDMPEFHDDENYGYIPRERVLCICTGSQGEMRAALSRIAHGSHPQVEFEEGDTVIFSSRTIPGNEKSVSAVQNALAANGVKIVTADDALVHVTGHPRRDELKQMYDWLQPDIVVPMHGEARHLWEQARFAKACGVPDSLVVRNGDIARLYPEPATIVDEAPWGRLHVDGKVIVSSVDGPARERRKLSFNGVVSVSLVVDRDGALQGDPELAMLGLPDVGEDGEAIDDIVYDVIEDVFDVLPKAKRRNDEVLEEFIYQAVRRAIDRQWGKKPLCMVSLHRI
jgi:ribonuclease J